jgi:endonuclease G
VTPSIWGSIDLARTANRDTFHFTNSCPQVAEVNQQTWLGLENYILQNARNDDMMVSVFTGPVFADDDFVYRRRIPHLNPPVEVEAQIPMAFWKVVAIVTETGRPSATAYRISQKREVEEELEIVFGAYRTFQVSIQQIIDETGIDFGSLVEFDGFTERERTTGRRTRRAIDELEMVLI